MPDGETLIEEAERVVSIALARSQDGTDQNLSEERGISSLLSDDIADCILAFRINAVERISTESHTAPKPITDMFCVEVTLTLTPRPADGKSLRQMRADADSPEIVDRVYHLKRFADGTWLFMDDLTTDV